MHARRKDTCSQHPPRTPPSIFPHFSIQSDRSHFIRFPSINFARSGTDSMEWTWNGMEITSLILPRSVPLNPSLSLPIVNCHLSNPGHPARNDVSEEHVRQEAAEEEESKFMLYLHTDTLNQGRHKSLFHRSHSIPFIQYTTGLSIFLSFFPVFPFTFHFSFYLGALVQRDAYI